MFGVQKFGFVLNHLVRRVKLPVDGQKQLHLSRAPKLQVWLKLTNKHEFATGPLRALQINIVLRVAEGV